MTQVTSVRERILEAKIKTLTDMVDSKDERIRQLEALFKPSMHYPVEWGLTINEQEILTQIYGMYPNVYTKDMYSYLVDQKNKFVDLKILDVYVCKIRKKLEDAGKPVSITTVWGRGYVLSDHNSKVTLDTYLTSPLSDSEKAVGT